MSVNQEHTQQGSHRHPQPGFLLALFPTRLIDMGGLTFEELFGWGVNRCQSLGGPSFQMTDTAQTDGNLEEIFAECTKGSFAHPSDATEVRGHRLPLRTKPRSRFGNRWSRRAQKTARTSQGGATMVSHLP